MNNHSFDVSHSASGIHVFCMDGGNNITVVGFTDWHSEINSKYYISRQYYFILLILLWVKHKYWNSRYCLMVMNNWSYLHKPNANTTVVLLMEACASPWCKFLAVSQFRNNSRPNMGAVNDSFIPRPKRETEKESLPAVWMLLEGLDHRIGGEYIQYLLDRRTR